MSNQLTAEQQRKIEENRRKALERRAQRLGQTVSTDEQNSAGFSGTSVQIQPPKQNVSTDHATIAHHGASSISVSAAQRFFSPFKKDTQTFSNQYQGLKHQQFSHNQTGQSTRCSSTSSRQVRLVHTLLKIYCWGLNNFQYLRANFMFAMFCIIFLRRYKLLTLFLRQKVNTQTALSPLVEEALLWTQLSPNLT